MEICFRGGVGVLIPEPDDLSQFLVSDDVVDWKNPAIVELSRKLTDGLTTDVAKARALFHWVRDTRRSELWRHLPIPPAG